MSTIDTPNNVDLSTSVFLRDLQDAPYDLRDCDELLMSVKRQAFDIAAVLHLRKGKGLVVVDALNGHMAINIPWDQMSALVGEYVYDVIGIWGQERRLLLSGAFSVSQGVTQ